MSDNFSGYARRRAWLVSGCFGLWGLQISNLWLLFFYELLILNTYFSVRTFATITPRGDTKQQAVDIILGLCLAAMPVISASPINFILIACLLFIVATIKYILLVSLIGFSKLLYNKILVDVLGILFCLSVLCLAILGDGRLAVVLLSVIFFFANIYVLWWEPLYGLKNYYEKN